MEKLKRWKEHFKQILNQPNPPELAYIAEAAEDLDINLIRSEGFKLKSTSKTQHRFLSCPVLTVFARRLFFGGLVIDFFFILVKAEKKMAPVKGKWLCSWVLFSSLVALGAGK